MGVGAVVVVSVVLLTAILCEAESASHEKKKYSSSANSATNAEVKEKEEEEVDINTLVCPELLQPEDVGFLVINLDRSPNRLQRMREQFDAHDVPQFERVRGVEYDPSKKYKVAKASKALKPADYGTALAHYEAWKAAYRSKHRWNVIMEDDAELVKGTPYRGPWPKVPKDADLVLLRRRTIFKAEPVCNQTTVERTTWGYGMVAYLVNRAGAKRMIDEAEKSGFRSPIDGYVWYHSKVYTMSEDWISHAPCSSPCTESIRTYLNGEIDEEPDQQQLHHCDN